MLGQNLMFFPKILHIVCEDIKKMPKWNSMEGIANNHPKILEVIVDMQVIATPNKFCRLTEMKKTRLISWCIHNSWQLLLHYVNKTRFEIVDSFFQTD